MAFATICGLLWPQSEESYEDPRGPKKCENPGGTEKLKHKTTEATHRAAAKLCFLRLLLFKNPFRRSEFAAIGVIRGGFFRVIMSGYE